MLILENAEFSELDEDIQTQCLGQVARVDNGLSQWWEWWDSGYANSMGQDMQAMENAIHIQCPSSGKTKCERSYCEFVERLILDGNNAGECLNQPEFDDCVDGGFNYSGIVRAHLRVPNLSGVNRKEECTDEPKNAKEKFLSGKPDNNTFAPERVSLRLDRSVETVQVFMIDLPVAPKQMDISHEPIQMELDRRIVEQDGVVRYTLTRDIWSEEEHLDSF